jgi:hypothetical protein
MGHALASAVGANQGRYRLQILNNSGSRLASSYGRGDSTGRFNFLPAYDFSEPIATLDENMRQKGLNKAVSVHQPVT